MEDDDDEFSSLTLKTSKKVGIGSTSTAIKKSSGHTAPLKISSPQPVVKPVIPLIAPPPNKSKDNVNKITNDIDLLDLNDNILPLDNNNNVINNDLMNNEN
jgi:hypothetical protein